MADGKKLWLTSTSATQIYAVNFSALDKEVAKYFSPLGPKWSRQRRGVVQINVQLSSRSQRLFNLLAQIVWTDWRGYARVPRHDGVTLNEMADSKALKVSCPHHLRTCVPSCVFRVALIWHPETPPIHTERSTAALRLRLAGWYWRSTRGLGGAPCDAYIRRPRRKAGLPLQDFLTSKSRSDEEFAPSTMKARPVRASTNGSLPSRTNPRRFMPS